MFVVTHPKLAEKATKIFESSEVPIHYTLNAEGTVSSEMMDVLGMVSIDKQILMSFMPTCFVDDLFHRFRRGLKLGVPNSGIAFTVPMTGASNLILRMINKLGDEDHNLRKDELTMSEIKHTMILAIVNQGYSEDVMEAARAAGAGGGTVVRSRRVSDEKTLSFWGMELQEEKDIVLIIAKTEQKRAIMQAIGEKCGMHTDAKGGVISLPVDAVIGLDEYK